MRTWSIQTLTMSFGGILLAIVLVGYVLGDRLVTAVLNLRDLTTVKVHGQFMYLAGELNTKTPDKIKKAISDNPQVTTLVLTQMPGSLDDEALFPFAGWVRQRGLNTHLQSTSEIASGAVDFFLAGKNRTMERGARIGVHSWKDGRNEGSDYPRQHSAHRIYANHISSMLGSESFYWFTIHAAPADALHWLSEAEVREFKLLTATPLVAKPMSGLVHN